MVLLLYTSCVVVYISLRGTDYLKNVCNYSKPVLFIAAGSCCVSCPAAVVFAACSEPRSTDEANQDMDSRDYAHQRPAKYRVYSFNAENDRGV